MISYIPQMRYQKSHVQLNSTRKTFHKSMTYVSQQPCLGNKKYERLLFERAILYMRDLKNGGVGWSLKRF